MNIHQFLNQESILSRDKNSRYTHTSIQPPQKYLIENPYIEKFWTVYCEECHDVRLTITERPIEDVMPVLCDVDIKLEVVDREDTTQNEVVMNYDNDMVISLIQVYHSVLFEIIQDLKEEDFICCVLEKDPYFITKNGKTYKKNGFHLHFPKIFLSKYIQSKELLPRIIQEVKKKNISKQFAFEKCIDTQYCKGAGWLMYGSSKSSDAKNPMYHPYTISYCIDSNMEKVDYRYALLDCNIYTSSENKINFSHEKVDFYLPRILSILNFYRNEYIYDLKSDLTPLNDLSIVKKKNRTTALTGDMMHDEESSSIELVEKLLDLVSLDRAKDYNEWLIVGWNIYNITKGSDEGHNLWKKFSLKCPDKYEEESLNYNWNRMEVRDMTIGSLKYMARKDNPEEYSKLIAEYMKPYIRKSVDLNGSHNDLAKALYQKYESEYVCTSIQNKVWYQFQNHIWKKLDEGISLRTKISEELVNLYFEMLNSLNSDLKHYQIEEDEKMEKEIKNRIRTVYSLVAKLKSAPFKNHIMREAMEVFYNESFMRRLDMDPMVISFKNGVYDLHTHEFRDGRPSDYLSLTLPISYNDNYDMNHPEVQAVMEFFTKIFPDRTVREYFMKLSSEIFIGGNHSKIFQIWTGDGDNGKSVMQALFEKMLGPYSIKLPTSLITGKRTQSSMACPELVRAGHGVRLAMLQEPDQTDTINIGILKELSGNDTFFARGLYKEGQEITPMFKLVLICNEPPKLPYNDRATWNRIRVIPFESTFTDDPPSSWEEQLLQKRFPKDKDFASKIPKMIEPFAWILLHTLKFNKKVCIEPEKVLMATSNYRKKNDVYRQFTDEFIIVNEKSQVSLPEIYSIFKDWYKESVPNPGGMPSKTEFKEYFIKLWGNVVDKIYWKGFEIRNAFDTPSSQNPTDNIANNNNYSSILPL